MIHTKVRATALTGANLDMEPKEISSPSGRAARRVTPTIKQFCPKPSSS